jgi:hypothetical protein
MAKSRIDVTAKAPKSSIAIPTQASSPLPQPCTDACDHHDGDYLRAEMKLA